jgi:GTP cyclohydrolase I
MKHFVNHSTLQASAKRIAQELAHKATFATGGELYVYPVPRGGVPAFYLVDAEFRALDITRVSNLRLTPVQELNTADVILDDLVDSGKTKQRLKELAPETPFYALIHKTADGSAFGGYKLGEWLVFPWEESEEKSVDDAFVRLLQFVGEDPTRGGLVETPLRMATAWKFWTSGYSKDPVDVLKTFEDGAETYDEMILVRDVPFYSQCEHHLAPFFGTVAFAYVPDRRIVGLSKMSRLVDVFARRLQVQERLTTQIADAFMDHVAPKGAACLIQARHMCMESRGVCQQGHSTITSALRGVLREPTPRAEFLALIK